MSVRKESTNQDIKKMEHKKPEVNDDKILMNSITQEENTGSDINSKSNHVDTEIGTQVFNTKCHATGEECQTSDNKKDSCAEKSNDKDDMINKVKIHNDSNKSEDDTDKEQKSALIKVTEGDSEGKNQGTKDIEPVDVENKNIKESSLDGGKGDTRQLSFMSAEPNDDTDDKYKQKIETACNSETVSTQQVNVKDDKASDGAKAKNPKYVKAEVTKGNFYNKIQYEQRGKKNKQQNQNRLEITDEKNKRGQKANKGATPNKKDNAALRKKAHEAYEFFWRSHSPYSQWYESDFTVDGIKFNCAEQYMMYSKAILFGDKQTAEKILNTSDPRKQKDLGRLVENFDKSVWDDSCSVIVECGNKAKFSQNQELKTTILKTFPKMLVEASPQDTIWGIGLDEKDPRAWDCKKWKGQNLLGKALTNVRDELMKVETSQNTVCQNTETKEERTTEKRMKIADSDTKKVDNEEKSLANNDRAEKITDV
ncbi:protein starmaker-like isoform X2 [Mytilus californianus]|nr:protein starmaker-like isoform X2 [Mytilus californianus]